MLTVRIACATVLAALPLVAEPEAGDVFREFTYGVRFSEVDPATRRPNLQARRTHAMAERLLDIGDFSGARRAEVVVSYWGGHIGTTEQSFSINGGDWMDIPQPAGTPGPPQCYYRTLLRATVEVPLRQLKAGANAFRFRAGPQRCYGFDWGFYWIYSFTVRLYYDPARVHPEGRIISHTNDAEIGERPLFQAGVESRQAPVQRVDFLARYTDYNWEGDGVYRQWHYILERGLPARHIGTAWAAPYVAVWNTQWVPDQDEPVEVAARVVDHTGLTYQTPSVRLHLKRQRRSVKMYRAHEVPEAFGVRAGRRKEAKINVTHDLSQARAARLVLSTWSAEHAEEIGLNGRKLVDRVGLVHNYSFDLLPVPMRQVRRGENVVHLFSSTKEHAAEVNWPGPALLVEFIEPPPPVSSQWTEPEATHRIAIDVDAAGYERRNALVETPFARAPLAVVDAASSTRLQFQYDRGELLFVAPEHTPAGLKRRFYAYFSDEPTPAAAAALPVRDDVDWQGQKSIRVDTPRATWIYQKEGAGFASLLDSDGADWISYRPSGGSAGNFRGIPNLGDQFGHPGHTGAAGSVSTVRGQGPLRVRIDSERRDRKWASTWYIYKTHARMTLHRAGAPYWFLYEGTPAGKLDEANGVVTLSNGERLPMSARWAGNIKGPKWALFSVPDSKWMLFVASHQQGTTPDQYWPMEGNMTVFGFGRQFTCCGKYFSETPATFTVGLLPRASLSETRAAIESLIYPLRIESGPTEQKP